MVVKEERLGAKITMQLVKDRHVYAQRKRYVPCELGSRELDQHLMDLLVPEMVDAVRMWLNQLPAFKEL